MHMNAFFSSIIINKLIHLSMILKENKMMWTCCMVGIKWVCKDELSQVSRFEKEDQV